MITEHVLEEGLHVDVEINSAQRFHVNDGVVLVDMEQIDSPRNAIAVPQAARPVPQSGDFRPVKGRDNRSAASGTADREYEQEAKHQDAGR